MDSISKIFSRVLLSDNIKVNPKLLTKTIHNTLLEKLREKLEGRCTKHGYIKKGSIEIYKTSPGKIEQVGLNGNTLYTIHFYADVCNPLVGSLVKCSVSSINKFGILAIAGYNDETEYISVIKIIIAKDSNTIVSEVDLDSVKLQDEILVEILGQKYELNDDKISAIGRVVKDASIAKKKKNDDNDIFLDDDEDVNDDIIENEDEEENDEENEEDTDDENGENEDDDEDDDKSSKIGGTNFFEDDDSILSDNDIDIFSNNDSENDDNFTSEDNDE